MRHLIIFASLVLLQKTVLGIFLASSEVSLSSYSEKEEDIFCEIWQRFIQINIAMMLKELSQMTNAY